MYLWSTEGSKNDAIVYEIKITGIMVILDIFRFLIIRKYTKGVKVIKPDGIPFTLEDSFEYRIKIDFETFKNADEEEARKLLAKEILASLVVFEKVKSKINNLLGKSSPDTRLHSFI